MNPIFRVVMEFPTKQLQKRREGGECSSRAGHCGTWKLLLVVTAKRIRAYKEDLCQAVY